MESTSATLQCQVTNHENISLDLNVDKTQVGNVKMRNIKWLHRVNVILSVDRGWSSVVERSSALLESTVSTSSELLNIINDLNWLKLW